MDIQMPILDGYAATRLIKADPALRSTSGLNQIAVISDAQRRSMRLRGQFSANKVPVAPDYFVLGLYVLETQSEYAWCLKI
jgi:CheY-like chemotaxis protein